jgi:guanine deaminase
VLLDLSDPAFVPFNSAARQLVFSETGRAVTTVVVDGRVVVRDGRVTSVDEQALRLELEARMPAYRQEFERMKRELRPLERAFEEQAKHVNARDVGIDRFL